MNEEYKQILDGILTHYAEQEQAKILAAYRIAEEAVKDRQRENKHPFIEHPLGVASIVANDLKLDSESVIAVFLHESIRFCPELLEPVRKQGFPKESIEMALGLNKIAAIKPKETRLEAENYKRLIVSYSKDPRAMLIKIADRLEVMRNIHLLPKSSQERKVTETMLLYIPIAHQLGLYNIKGELENIFFRHTEPEMFREISNKLKAGESEREKMLEEFLEPIRRNIRLEGIKIYVKSRTKSAYSIWKKMQKQNIPFEKVRDILAVRIIIDTPGSDRELEKDLCWKVYSIVTHIYEPDVSRMRDWISHPKVNGYESLHTTVSYLDDQYVEVQIRTKRMDDVAENGDAAHWSYKGLKQEKGLTPWLQSLRELLESGGKTSYEHVSSFLTEDVFVFTPDGELRRLPAGATVLDFAFNIHSNLGLKCTGAIIDGKAVSIKDRLKTGDVVEIKSGKNQKPSPDWLNYVVSSKARSRIKIKLNEAAMKKAAEGKELLDRRLKNWKLELTDEDLTTLYKKHGYKTASELFAAIADETIDVMSIKAFLTEEDTVPGGKGAAGSGKAAGEGATGGKSSGSPKNKSGSKGEETDFLVIDGKLSNIGYKMAKCCNPIYGDDVFGFVSIKEGIKIHRMSCPNAARLMENYPYRIQKVRWKEDVTSGSFQTCIKVVIDDTSVYGRLLEVVTGFGASIRSSSIMPRGGRGSGEFDVRIQIHVESNSKLDSIISTMRKTRGVISAIRVTK